MEIIAGLSLKNLKPRVWDPKSEYFLPSLRAVMVSYADFHTMPVNRKKAMDIGLRAFLRVPRRTKIYMDNGAFYFLNREGQMPHAEYENFVKQTQPDWYPVPQEYIPTPVMSPQKRYGCLRKTMAVNRRYHYDSYVPIAHVSSVLPRYVREMLDDENLVNKSDYALGGIVPNLLRSPKAMPYGKILSHLIDFKMKFAGKNLHLFGIGGTATVHIAALAGFSTVDSSGWRNRAVRGLVQLPGRGDRVVADLGKWRGRELSQSEKTMLDSFGCVVCAAKGWKSLKEKGLGGFCNRATHNLWVLLEEAEWVSVHIANLTYREKFESRLENTVYKPIIKQTLKLAVERNILPKCPPTVQQEESQS